MDIFDILAQRQMQSEIDHNRAALSRGDMDVLRLEAKVRSLEMVVSALWSVLKDRLKATDDELQAEIERICAARPDTCPSCGRKLLVLDSPTCSWCGEPVKRQLSP